MSRREFLTVLVCVLVILVFWRFVLGESWGLGVLMGLVIGVIALATTRAQRLRKGTRRPR